MGTQAADWQESPTGSWSRLQDEGLEILCRSEGWGPPKRPCLSWSQLGFWNKHPGRPSQNEPRRWG